MRGNMLKAAAIMKGTTLTGLAKAIGMPYVTFSTKLNGKSDFTRAEIQMIKDCLNLSAEDINDIFFAEDIE